MNNVILFLKSPTIAIFIYHALYSELSQCQQAGHCDTIAEAQVSLR